MDDDDRIERAAYEGGASGLIKGLPKGYDTILGKEFDEGVDLSGGEWQKIALSRAFMKEAEVLILDEPTAALDAFAERDVFSRFAELTSDRTAIFISYRFSTVRMADHILVCSRGSLSSRGLTSNSWIRTADTRRCSILRRSSIGNGTSHDLVATQKRKKLCRILRRMLIIYRRSH